MQSIINLTVSIFLGIIVLVCVVAIATSLFIGLDDEQADAKMFGIGGIVGITSVLSAIAIYLMKTRGLI